MMRKSLYLILAVPLVLSTFSTSQFTADLQADEQQLRQQKYQLQHDRDRCILIAGIARRGTGFELTKTGTGPDADSGDQSRHQARPAGQAA